MMIEHEFTPQIIQILQNHFGDDGISIFERSSLLQYLVVHNLRGYGIM